MDGGLGGLGGGRVESVAVAWVAGAAWAATQWHGWRRHPGSDDRAVYAPEPRHNSPAQKTQEIPVREEFKGLSPEEIEALEATATGEGKLNTAMVDALMARRRATIYVAVIRQHNQLLVRTSDEKTMEQIRDLVRRVDVPTPLVLLEVKILQVNLGDDFNSVFDYQFSDGATIAGGFVPSSLIVPPAAAFTTGNILPPVGNSDLTPDTPLAPAASPGVAGTPNPPLLFQFVNNNFRYAHAVAGKQQPRDHAGHAAALDGQQRSQPAFRRAGSAAEPGFHRAHAAGERHRDLDAPMRRGAPTSSSGPWAPTC